MISRHSLFEDHHKQQRYRGDLLASLDWHVDFSETSEKWSGINYKIARRELTSLGSGPPF